MSRKKKQVDHQFFTTEEKWLPIDHFFFAPVVRGKLSNGGSYLKEENKVVHLETHATLDGGMGISITTYNKSFEHGYKTEEYKDVPSALRRMADIIEANSKEK